MPPQILYHQTFITLPLQSKTRILVYIHKKRKRGCVTAPVTTSKCPSPNISAIADTSGCPNDHLWNEWSTWWSETHTNRAGRMSATGIYMMTINKTPEIWPEMKHYAMCRWKSTTTTRVHLLNRCLFVSSLKIWCIRLFWCLPEISCRRSSGRTKTIFQLVTGVL